MTIRSTIAKKLTKINKLGDMNSCFAPSSASDNTIYEYCVKYFSDNFVKFDDCKNPKNFCYVCCENEFGEVHVLEREKCYAKCEVPVEIS